MPLSALAEAAVPANDDALIETLWKDWSPDFESKHGLEDFKKCVSNLSRDFGFNLFLVTLHKI